MPNVSVIVVTRRRIAHLKKLLDSLAKQTIPPFEILVVVNDADIQKERSLVNNYSQLPATCAREPRVGIPIARNTGIRKAKGDVIAFIDDDCRATDNWIEQIALAHTKSQADTSFLGYSESIPKTNFYVNLTANHYKDWLETICDKDYHCCTFDTKNLSFKKSVFDDKNNLFNEKLRFGSDDIELGYRLTKRGFKIRLDRNIVVYHQERTNYTSFLKQRLRIALGEAEVRKTIKDFTMVYLFPPKKSFRHIKSMLRQEFAYIKRSQFSQASRYFFVFITLFFIRIFGYLLRDVFFYIL